MPGIGAYMLAGAASGLGESLVSKAKQARENALLMLERNWQLQDDALARSRELADRAAKDKRVREMNEKVGSIIDALAGAESGGDFGADNGQGYVGRLQFGQARLDDYANAMGIGRISPEEFKANPELQKDVEKWHVSDIRGFIKSKGLDRYIGKKVGDAKITEAGMIAAAHIGGKEGLRKFIETGGEYDPADSNGTRISDYMRRMAGATIDEAEILKTLADPDVSPAQREAINKAMRLRGLGGKPVVELTGEEWRDNGKGQMVLYGRTKDGRMIPYRDEDGKPFTKPSKAKDPDLSAATDLRLQRRFGRLKELGVIPADEYKAMIKAVKEEILRMMREQGMSEAEAEAVTVDRMIFEPPDPNSLYPDLETGPFTGRFKPYSTWLRDNPPAGPPVPGVRGVEPGAQGQAPAAPRGLMPPAGPAKPASEPVQQSAAPQMPQDPGARPIGPAEKVQALAAARIAISEGKDPEQVARRLRSIGIDPSEIVAEISEEQKRDIFARARSWIAQGTPQEDVIRALIGLGLDPAEANLYGGF